MFVQVYYFFVFACKELVFGALVACGDGRAYGTWKVGKCDLFDVIALLR